MTRRVPVALFTYSRPEHTRAAFEALARSPRLDECLVTVYCDGPRSSADEPRVADSRRVVSEWAPRLHAQVVERTENLGLARSIVGGVDALCTEHGRCVVIEDDLVVHRGFLHYVLEALARYESDERVYQVSGFMFPVRHPDAPDCFFLPLTTTWGWATWARAWRVFDWTAAGAPAALDDAATRKRFDLDGSYPYARMLEDRLAGGNDSWGILWWWSVFAADGLVLHPRRSLVQVGGFDGSGTHHRAGAPFEGQSSPDESWLGEAIRFPEAVQTDDAAMGRIRAFLRAPSAERSTASWLARPVAWLKRWAGRHA
jgi:GT2 family glycosyltransferase